MRVVIVGAGKLGYHLTKMLNEENHMVSTIEINKNLCEKLALEVDSLVICGNATKLQDLKDAEIECADVLIAATGKDEENLLICQIAKMHFNITKTVARINNPKNERIFRELGIEYTVSSTKIIANIIEEETLIKGLKTLLTLDKGEVSLIEYVVDKNAMVSGQKIKDLVLPTECNIAYIQRKGTVIIPRGEVSLEVGDHVISVVSHSQKKQLQKLFTEKMSLISKWSGGKDEKAAL